MEAAPPCSVLLGFPLRGSTAFKDSSASVWSPNFSRSFPSPTWTSWLNLSICSQVTWNCFFLCVLCFLKCLIMSCSGSSSVTYDRKIWSPVQAAVIPQIPKDVAPKVHFFLFLSLFFLQEIIVSLSYIVHSLQYKVLKCPRKININVTVARIFNKIDPCHS